MYLYLASPYSDPDPMVRERRYLAAAEALQTLLQNRLWTYSPIVHCHEVAKIWDLPRDAKFWQDYNHAMLEGSRGLFVLRLPGWDKSLGVKDEIKHAREFGLTTTYLSHLEIMNDAATVKIPGC